MANLLPVGTVIFEDVSKRYRLGALDSLRSTLAAMRPDPSANDNPKRTLWALRNASFRLDPGTSLGLIGPNGAGKTTTLKLLSSITQPASGRIQVSGRLSSMIELGAGFHPELTGRENIFLNGAILGLKQAEIARRIDDIIAFSELERFIDTPVKRYSSGMYVRLGFAVAAHVEPDILLVDEVMAVGDAQFRQKCMTRMQELRARGTTLVFVSHNMHMVKSLCRRALVLFGGRIMFDGPTDEAIELYEKSWRQAAATGATQTSSDSGHVHISQIELLGEHDERQHEFKQGDCLHVRATVMSSLPIESPVIRVRVLAEDGSVVSMMSTLHQSQAARSAWTLRDQTQVGLMIPALEVVTGNYAVEVRVLDTTDSEVLAAGQSEQFFVQSPGLPHETDRGVYLPRVNWLLPERRES